MRAMRRAAPSLLALSLLIPVPALAQDAIRTACQLQPLRRRVPRAEMEAAFGVGPHSYEVRVDYHTTGVVSLFHHGHQLNTVVGTWEADRPQPQEFQSVGVWQGEDKVTLIDYLHGQPLVRRLIPPQDKEREPVPLSLQQNSVDSLSALALMIRRVTDTGRCDASVHTFDGNRASEITAHTVGEEMLAAERPFHLQRQDAALRLSRPDAGRVPVPGQQRVRPPAAARLGLACQVGPGEPPRAGADAIRDPLVRRSHDVSDASARSRRPRSPRTEEESKARAPPWTRQGALPLWIPAKGGALGTLDLEWLDGTGVCPLPSNHSKRMDCKDAAFAGGPRGQSPLAGPGRSPGLAFFIQVPC